MPGSEKGLNALRGVRGKFGVMLNRRSGRKAGSGDRFWVASPGGRDGGQRPSDAVVVTGQA